MDGAILDELEQLRISLSNRLRILTRGGPADERLTGTEARGYKGPKYNTVSELPPDKDDEERGWGLHGDDVHVQFLIAALDVFNEVEKNATKILERDMRTHPLGPFVKSLTGVGDKQAGRLVAAIGDPYIRPEIRGKDGTSISPQRPRMVSELLSYSGLVPEARRQRGQKSFWNPKARMRAWNVIASCMKQTRGHTSLGTCVPDETFIVDDEQHKQPLVHADDCRCSPYRVIYDDARRRYANAVDDDGEPLTAKHQLARAQRLMMRALIKDLWAEARRIHTGDTS
jgi:hypothetical protein